MLTLKYALSSSPLNGVEGTRSSHRRPLLGWLTRHPEPYGILGWKNRGAETEHSGGDPGIPVTHSWFSVPSECPELRAAPRGESPVGKAEVVYRKI